MSQPPLNYAIRKTDGQLSGNIGWLFTILWLHCDQLLRCHPGDDLLMTETGIKSSATIQKHRNELVKRKAIILVPVDKRKGEKETSLSTRKYVYQVTGVMELPDGKLISTVCFTAPQFVDRHIEILQELDFDLSLIFKALTLKDALIPKGMNPLEIESFKNQSQSNTDSKRSNTDSSNQKESLSPDKVASSDNPDNDLPVLEDAQDTVETQPADNPTAVEEIENGGTGDYQLPQFMKLAILAALSRKNESVVDKAEAHIAALEGNAIAGTVDEITEPKGDKTPKQIQDEYQEIIRRVFGEWKDEKSPPEILTIGHLTTNLMKFFRGMHTSGKKSLANQLETPWSVAKIAALYAYYRRTYKTQNRIPRTYETLREKCDELDALPPERQQRYLEEGQRLVDRVLGGKDLESTPASNGARFDNFSAPKPEDYKVPDYVEYT